MASQLSLLAPPSPPPFLQAPSRKLPGSFLLTTSLHKKSPQKLTTYIKKNPTFFQKTFNPKKFKLLCILPSQTPSSDPTISESFPSKIPLKCENNSILTLLFPAAVVGCLLGALPAHGTTELPLSVLDTWMGLAPEPANALSLPTWTIHVASVVEWVTAMALVWQYGSLPGRATWRGLAWGMLPLLGGAMCACTWHFFYNAPSLEVVVALQGGMTLLGNFTLWIAAYRIYSKSQEGSAP